MIKLDAEQRQSLGRVQDLNIGQLDAQENKLNRLTQYYAQIQVKSAANLARKLALAREEIEEKKRELRFEAQSLKELKQGSLSQGVELDRELRDVSGY